MQKEILNYVCRACSGELWHMYKTKQGGIVILNFLICNDCGNVYSYDVQYKKAGNLQ